MTYTYDENIFSDLYKDTFGFRPRGHEFYQASPMRKQEIWDFLMVAHGEEMERYHAEQARQTAEFEKLITDTIKLGARDRETAIRWLLDDLDDDESLEYYGGSYACFHLNVPYSYKAEFNKILGKPEHFG